MNPRNHLNITHGIGWEKGTCPIRSHTHTLSLEFFFEELSLSRISYEKWNIFELILLRNQFSSQ